MKNKLFIAIIAAATLSACNNMVDTTTLTNQTIIIDTANTHIKINYPVALNTQNPQAADSINNYISEILSEMPTKSDSTIFPLESMLTWNAQTNSQITQITLSSYLFTGGAHGMSNLWTATFNNKTGEKINPLKYVNNKAAMLKIIASELKADSIPLFAEADQTPMPEYLIIEPQYVTAIYNQYEIAPYSSGIIQIKMPYTQLTNIFDTTAIKPATLTLIKCTKD